MKKKLLSLQVFTLLLAISYLHAFQSDELLVDDEEFGLEGGNRQPQERIPDPVVPTRSTPTRRKYSDSDLDSKIQITLEHAFGDSDFFPAAATFSARLKTWSHGAQTLTKLRFSRNAFTEVEREKFQKLLEDDEFYRIRFPSNVLNPPGKDFVISSVRARCLPQDSLDEHFVIHMPAKWTFISHTVLKNSEQAPRAPIFAEDTTGEQGEGEAVPLPERSFWAKYWMYLIPLGLIVMNAITQAMNMPEEQGAGQSGAQSAGAIQRGPSPAVRRR